jgi:hypothetical protein
MAKIFMEDDNRNMTLTWENISAHVPEEKSGFFSFMKKKVDIERRQILEDGN